MAKCRAMRTNGVPCTQWAIKGGVVCVTHGGKAPQVKAAAQRRLQRAQLTSEVALLLEELDPEDQQHPVEVILEAVHRSAAMGRLLEQLVGMLAPTFDPDRLDDRGRQLAGLWGPDHLGDASPHVLVNLLGEWTDRQAKLAKVALDANVDEQRTRLAERQVALIEDAVNAALDAAGVNGQAAGDARRAIAARLRPAS